MRFNRSSELLALLVVSPNKRLVCSISSRVFWRCASRRRTSSDFWATIPTDQSKTTNNPKSFLIPLSSLSLSTHVPDHLEQVGHRHPGVFARNGEIPTDRLIKLDP